MKILIQLSLYICNILARYEFKIKSFIDGVKPRVLTPSPIIFLKCKSFLDKKQFLNFVFSLSFVSSFLFIDEVRANTVSSTQDTVGVLERLNTGGVDLTCESCTHFSDPSTSDCPKEWLKLAVLRGDKEDKRGTVNMPSPDELCIDKAIELPSSREPLKTANEVEVYLRGQAGISSLKGVPVMSQCLSEPVKVSRVGNWSATAFDRTLPESKHKVALAEYYYDLHRLDQGMGEAVDNIAAIDHLIPPAGGNLLQNVSCSKMLSKEAEESCKAVSQCKSSSLGLKNPALEQASQNTIVAMQAINEMEAKINQLTRGHIRLRPKDWKAQAERLESSKRDIENLYPWVVGRKFQNAYSAEDFKGFTSGDNKELIAKMSGIITEQLSHTRDSLQKRQEEMHQAHLCLTENKCNEVDLEQVLSTTSLLDEKKVFASNDETKDLRRRSLSALFSQVSCLQTQRRDKAELNKELAFAGLDLAIIAGTMGLGSGIVGAKMAATAAIRAGGAASKAQKLSGVQRLQGLGVIGADTGASTPFMNEAMKQCDSLLNQLESIGEQQTKNKEDLCESMPLQVKHTSDLKGCMLQAGLSSLPAVFGIGALAGGLAIGAKAGAKAASKSTQVVEALGDDISGLTQRQLRGLGTKVRNFTPSQLATLGDNVQHLTQRQLRALGDNVQHLTERQLRALGDKVEHLTKKQFKALGNKVDDLTPEQRRAWVYSNFVDPVQRERMIRELNSGSGNRSVLSAAAADVNKAEDVLGKKLTAEQAEAVQRAHLVGASDELGKDGINPPGIGNYTEAQLRQKNEILRAAGFSQADRRSLMEAGVVGKKSWTKEQVRNLGFQLPLTESQITELGDDIRYLTMGQIDKLDTRHLTTSQIEALEHWYMRFNTDQVQALGDKVKHLNARQLQKLGWGFLTEDQIQAIGKNVRHLVDSDQLGSMQIASSIIKKLGTNVQHLTANQLRALHPNGVVSLTSEQLKAPGVIEKLGGKLRYLTEDQLKDLGKYVQGFNERQLNDLGPSNIQSLITNNQIIIDPNVNPDVIQYLGVSVKHLNANQLQTLGTHIKGLTKDQIRALGYGVQDLTEDQVQALGKNVKYLTTDQLNALNLVYLTKDQAKALGWRQLRGLPILRQRTIQQIRRQ